MFSSQVMPIAIDFGASSVKMLQVSPEEPPTLVAAAEIEVPDKIRNSLDDRMEFLGEQIPNHIRRLRFKGKRAMFSIPSVHTFVQHIQAPTSGAVTGEEFVRNALQAQTGYAPSNLVIRTAEVAEIVRDGAAKKETICFAVPKDIVMRHIEILKRAKLEVVGVHTEQHAGAWAFAHINRRAGDLATTSLLVDAGWAGTKVAISHGMELIFAKTIPIGGVHFERALMESRKCDVAAVRTQRRSAAEGAAREWRERASGARGKAAAASANAGAQGKEGTSTAVAEERRKGDSSTLLRSVAAQAQGKGALTSVEAEQLAESIADELAMCLRYHQVHFGRRVDRAIFIGGESHHVDFWTRVAERLDVAAYIGDPMARLSGVSSAPTHGFRNEGWLPQFAVACGLCSGVEQS